MSTVSSECSSKSSSPVETTEKKPLKPCCACPQTKRVRDECMVQKGEDKCGAEIEAHKQCMRKMGFNI